MEFCEICGAIMFPSTHQGRRVLSCKCGNHKSINESHFESYKISKRIKHSLKDELESTSQIEKWKEGEDFGLDYDAIFNRDQKIEKSPKTQIDYEVKTKIKKLGESKQLTFEERFKKNQEKLKVHMDTIQIENSEIVQKTDIIKKSESGKYHCICGEEFSIESNFFNHFKLCRSDLFSKEEDGLFYCSCGNYFFNELSLFYHYQSNSECLYSKLSGKEIKKEPNVEVKREKKATFVEPKIRRDLKQPITIQSVDVKKESILKANARKEQLKVSGSKNRKIHETINRWLNKLIDLSRRNRQLYFKRTKTSTVELIKPSPEKIFDLLVNKRKELTIIYRDLENLNKSKKDLTDSADAEIQINPLDYNKPLKKGEILTDKEDKELYKSLRNLLSRSRSSFQEQGVNILFLAFGFLEWKDTSFTEGTNLSPLILVPVLLKRVSLLQPYKIQFFDDDILLNPALRVKLENDFNVNLPLLEEDFEDLEDMFNKIASNIFIYSEAKDWKIHKDVFLSFFSFSKLMMYRDIKDNKDLIENHEILSNLILEKSKEQIDYLSGEDLDQKSTVDIFNILDADSSQQNAILNAENGKTFSIQGPPGTGKSQTIANVVASSLIRGKSVLFVSEKMAALEVVMKRLEECGFDEFCLELHSFKSNKKTVYEELGRCLQNQEEYKKPEINFLNELDQTKFECFQFF